MQSTAATDLHVILRILLGIDLLRVQHADGVAVVSGTWGARKLTPSTLSVKTWTLSLLKKFHEAKKAGMNSLGMSSSGWCIAPVTIGEGWGLESPWIVSTPSSTALPPAGGFGPLSVFAGLAGSCSDRCMVTLR